MPGLDNRTIIFVAGLVYVVLAGAAAISSAALRRYRGPGYSSSDLFQRHWFFTATLLALPLGTLALVLSLLTLAMSRFSREVEARRVELSQANDQLRAALENVRVLSGLLRICAWCRRIAGDDGAWHQLEAYVRQHSEAEFTHGMCPDCAAGVRAEIPRSAPSPHRPTG